ncbi:MAG: flagellar biosynthesis protein FlhF [Halieaceae bacterium]|nr:flagellar biosynthesis protein FlhF [Halieaceae bacterium]
MRIERFRAHDSRTAMAQVRAALGADALILANRRIGDLVEVTAAVDVEQALEGPAAAAGDAPQNELQLKALERELHRLRGILEKELGQSSWRDSAQQPPALAALRQHLLRMGFSRSLAGEVLDRLPRTGHIDQLWTRARADLAQRLVVTRLPATPSVTALFGGTGVGKTGCIARLAARAVQRRGAEAVALVTLDNYRIGAHEQLASFAELLGLPLRPVADRHSLSLALREFRDRQVFIDTAGMAQHDPRLVAQVSLLEGVAGPVHRLLVLAASAQPAQSRALLQTFGRARLSGAIISKVDEAHSLGGVLDVLIASGLPLVGLTDGQRIPEDWQEPQAEQLLERAAGLARRDPVLVDRGVGNAPARMAG